MYNNYICPLQIVALRSLTLARACAAKGYCSLSARFVAPFLRTFSLETVAAVDTKRGYVGMCNGRSAQ